MAKQQARNASHRTYLSTRIYALCVRIKRENTKHHTYMNKTEFNCKSKTLQFRIFSVSLVWYKFSVRKKETT